MQQAKLSFTPELVPEKDQSQIQKEDEIVKQAISILHGRLKKFGDNFVSSSAVKNFLSLKLLPRDNEVFSVMFFSTSMHLISYEEMFYGDHKSSIVHPRFVVKRALELNADSVIFAHNHPSQTLKASEGDKLITKKLVSSLNVFDIVVRDHIIVAGEDTLSFAEQGLL